MNKFKVIFSKIISKENRFLFLGAIIFGLILGLIFSGGNSGADPSSSTVLKDELSSKDHDHKKGKIWTCSMHPHIRQPKPGQCPLCGMDLIPATSGEEQSGLTELKLSEYAIKLAEIQVEKVKYKYVEHEIPLVGKVEFDETKVGTISSWIPGRIDKLYVDYTGITVKKGDHLVSLYSPELIIAQQELIQASKNLKRYQNSQSSIRKMASQTLTIVKKKLSLWGLKQSQIDRIENKGKIEDHLTIYSPMKGIVIHKNAVEGMYVKTGTKIYTIADLSKVWIKLDVYESDLSWIRYGQSVEFETESYPGKTFTGKISFIDPVLNAKTRTVKLRVNVSNQDFKLKPGMFVRATIKSRLTKSGKVMDPDLIGKWISPMHPEIVKDKPGNCDVCGMKLVKAESLGYASIDEDEKDAPLVIPVSAALITGKRSIVYISKPGKKGVFEGREVVLGPRAGNYYIVKMGLKEGEDVVVNGAFKIDSDLQIQAKPSMMNPQGGVSMKGHDHGSTAEKSTKKDNKKHVQKKISVNISKIPALFKLKVDAISKPYFAIGKDLSGDTLKNIKMSAKDLLSKLKDIDMNLLKGDSHMVWMKIETKISKNAKKLISISDIDKSRAIFEKLTDSITEALKHFGSGKEKVYRFHCPMAFDSKGAFWLQDNSDTKNPYFGSAMLLCKDLIEPLYKKTEDKK